MTRQRALDVALDALVWGVVGINAAWAGSVRDWGRWVHLAVALALTAFAAYSHGRRHALRTLVRATAWLPEEVRWHRDDDGVVHALVTQQSGTVQSIAIPEDVESASAAFDYVIGVLADE